MDGAADWGLWMALAEPATELTECRGNGKLEGEMGRMIRKNRQKMGKKSIFSVQKIHNSNIVEMMRSARMKWWRGFNGN
jgi:hypothetical protein